MKILQLCNKPPFPPVDGGSIAMHSITEGLLKLGHKIKVFSVATDKHKFLERKIPSWYFEQTEAEAYYIDTKIKAWPALKNLFSSNSYNIERFISEAFANKLSKILQDDSYDIIQLESLFVAPYIDTIRKCTNAPIVLRAHNVEHIIWERLSKSARFPLKKAYLKLLAKRMKAFEQAAINQVDGVAAITNDDKNIFKSLGCTKPVEVFPVGVDSSKYVSKGKPEYPSLFFLGAMDWKPNDEGLVWFINEVWPKATKAFPKLKFYIAGRKMPNWLSTGKWKNIEVLGEVPSALEFINSKSMMVVPLLSGGGMRVKIIEGMALSKCILSTSVGAEGIDYTDETNILIADTPEAFVDKIAFYLEDQKRSENIGKNARSLISMKYDNRAICEKLTYFYRNLQKA